MVRASARTRHETASGTRLIDASPRPRPALRRSVPADTQSRTRQPDARASVSGGRSNAQLPGHSHRDPTLGRQPRSDEGSPTPTLRSDLDRALADRGMSVQRIAARAGVTEVANRAPVSAIHEVG